LTCSVCESEVIFRKGRCDRDYRWWREHGEDRVFTEAERMARAVRLDRNRLERALIREVILASGG
jgi:hypothetical protein